MYIEIRSSKISIINHIHVLYETQPSEISQEKLKYK